MTLLPEEIDTVVRRELWAWAFRLLAFFPGQGEMRSRPLALLISIGNR
jgi:hypothetical protein